MDNPRVHHVRNASPRAFTLIETIVAIGAMALVAVGIAAIFQSVGKAVSGGKRVSTLNAYAAMVENQMRRDFESITRDGFFVIRSAYADADNNRQFVPTAIPSQNLDAVPLDALDSRPRPRRVDEMLFFTTGDFASSREPLNSNYIARSKAARIYYGHGLRYPPPPDLTTYPNNPYWRPEITDAFSPATVGRLGGANPTGGTNPNRYASSWTLLRQEALLIKPDTSAQSLPAGAVFTWRPGIGAGSSFLIDKIGQIALQPSAWSLFRQINFLMGTPPTTTRYVRNGLPAQTNETRPQLASGIVNIVNTDLSEIRSVVTTMALAPGAVTSAAQCTPAGTVVVPPVGTLAGPDRLARQWMDEAFPANSDPFNVAADHGARIRYEPGPTNFVGAITTGTPVEKAYRRIDQLALCANNFVPGCTEFILEYSFADSDNGAGGTQELIWHGLSRQTDSDGDGQLTTADRFVALPYPDFCLPNGTVVQRPVTLRYATRSGATYNYLIRKNLLYNNAAANTISETAYFGYIDPMINPDRTNPPNGNNSVLDDEDDANGVVPWPWPKLVRVTMTLTDPANPTSEETFQFVFRIGKPGV